MGFQSRLEWALEMSLDMSLIRLFIKGFNNSFTPHLLPFLNHCDYYEVTFLTTGQTLATSNKATSNSYSGKMLMKNKSWF